MGSGANETIFRNMRLGKGGGGGQGTDRGASLWDWGGGGGGGEGGRAFLETGDWRVSDFWTGWRRLCETGYVSRGGVSMRLGDWGFSRLEASLWDWGTKVSLEARLYGTGGLGCL